MSSIVRRRGSNGGKSSSSDWATRLYNVVVGVNGVNGVYGGRGLTTLLRLSVIVYLAAVFLLAFLAGRQRLSSSDKGIIDRIISPSSLLRGGSPLMCRQRRPPVVVAVVKGDSSPLERYPYMTSPVDVDHDFSTYNPPGGNRFAEYKDGDAPYLITSATLHMSDELARSRRIHVANAMKHVWKNYRAVYGKDEMKPMTGNGSDRWGGMGTTLVDSLDTMWLIGLKDEFWEGRDHVRDHLRFDNVGYVSFFETTIRNLGGLLSAYEMSHDDVFLEKADELGKRLAKACDTPSGMPHGSVDLRAGKSNNQLWNGNDYILAEVGTHQLEFRYLSRATGKRDYADKSMRAFDVLRALQPSDGLLFEHITEGKNNRPAFANGKVSFGAMGDSAYEYMLKIWIQGGRKEVVYRRMYDKAMTGMHEQLLHKSSLSGLTYIANRIDCRIEHKMDHLVCFLPGALALGAYTDPLGLDSPRARRDLKTARSLAYTCYQMYARTSTGMAPEYVRFEDENDMVVPRDAPYSILRPEAVEAFYYLSTLTGDPIYREWGWEVFQSIEKFCKTKYGYGGLKDVDMAGSVEDRMESFFLAETLKYLYLLFDPDSEIDILNKHVFNTEAHPLRIFED